MAHHVRQSALADELVSQLAHVTGQTDSKRFKTLRDSTLRQLRHHNYLRTNHFDVFQQLNGLEEKFRVFNEDPLADALQERIDLIANSRYKWAPEVLHLLVELSDQPVLKSKIEDIEFLRPPLEEEHRWTWEELAAEDPLLRDKTVFGTINYASESSDDGDWYDTPPPQSEASDNTGASSLDEYAKRVEDFAVALDASKYSVLTDHQFWHESSVASRQGRLGERLVTGLQVVREILFMLHGLPTSLFRNGRAKQTIITPVPGYYLRNTTPEVFYKLLNDFSEQGTGISGLRDWTQQKQTIPLMQVLQAEILKRLQWFDSLVTEVESSCISIEQDTIISILDIQGQLEPAVTNLLAVAEILGKLQADPHISTFRYLELLYDEICSCQLAGKDTIYSYLAELFLNCFQAYLSPLRLWMEDGQLLTNDKSFFVSESTDKTEFVHLWQDRYMLRKTPEGKIFAPVFMQHLVSKIFTSGKSVVVLKHLHINIANDAWWSPSETMNIRDLCGPTSNLVPFAQLLSSAFDNWVMHKHRLTAARLQETLFINCGLDESLDALELVYLMKDGATSGHMMETIFEKLDGANSNWCDRFNLTELAHDTLGSLSRVSEERLKIKITPVKLRNIHQERRTVRSLSMMRIEYLLPWPVQLIINEDALRSYQSIFLLLFQVRRATYTLQRLHLVRDDPNHDSSSTERSLFYILRSRLLWFTTTIYNYLTECVLEISTRTMRKDLASASDLDDMIKIHQTYIKRIEAQALLITRLKPIHRAIIVLLDLTIRLGDIRATHEHAEKSFRASVRGVGLPIVTQSPRYAQTPRRPRRRAASSSEDDDSDDNREGREDDDEAVAAASLTLSDAEAQMTYAEHLQKMRAECDHQCRFIATGLRGVARAGGEPSWDMLAEKLESGLGLLI